MMYHQRPFFADFIDEFQLIENTHGLGLNTSDEQEALHYHSNNHQDFDTRITNYLLKHDFVQDTRVESEQYCLITFHASEAFCACSRIYDPILNSWWYAILLSRTPKTPDRRSGNTVWGTIK
jgi:hypothetical protein